MEASLQLDRWLWRPARRQGRLRLFCFCYAGGSAAAFADWPAGLDPEIEVCAVQLPGRGTRFLEEPYTTLRELIPQLSRVVSAVDDRPYAFFGHSLGALLAFEVARYRAAAGMSLPIQLFVSGCQAPRYRSLAEGLHLLDDAALLEKLKSLNGTPPEILAHRELMAVLLPSIRADLALAYDYVYAAGPPLTLPLAVLAGRDDEFDHTGQIDSWCEETTGPRAVHWFDGDHFFIQPQRAAVLRCLDAILAPYLAAPCPRQLLSRME